MRVLQDDTFALVVMPHEEAHGPSESLPTAAETSAFTLQSTQVSTQVRVQTLYRECLLLLLRNNVRATIRPQHFSVHSQSIRTIATGLWQPLYKLLHRYPATLLHHTTTHYQSSVTSYRHHYVHHNVCLPLFLPTYVNNSSISTVSVGVWPSTRSGRVS